MKVLDKILYCLYPDKCIACDKLVSRGKVFCPECEFTYGNNLGYKTGDSFLPKTVYSVMYEEDIKQAIWKYKFRSKKYYIRPFSSLLVEAFDYYYMASDFDVILAVPTTDKSKAERGYNHAALLGKAISKREGIPYQDKALIKLKETNQHEKTLAERRGNVKGAYKVSLKADLKGKRVLLVDDIITTGYTMETIARLIKKAGAKSVNGIVLAAASTKPLAKYR